MRRATLVSLCLIALLAPAALADGMMFPTPVAEKQPFSVTYHRVQVEIRDQACRTAVDQAFVNHSGRDLEGTYLFPLPEQAHISKFVMFENGKPLTGELLTKEQAVKVYEEIVRKKRDPGLLEYVGRNTIRARVFPVPARGEKRFQVEYSELLKIDGGLIKYVYPLSTERFSAQPLNELTISVSVHSRVPIKSIYSPSHEISVKRGDDHRATVSFEATKVRPATDFVLYIALSQEEVGLTLLSYREPGREGYWMLLASPKVPGPDEVVPKDVVFVLDRTGSMSGEKIEQAKGALRYCLNSLDERDRFDVIAFNESPESLGDRLMPANRENTKKALAFVGDLRARGGTNIDEALRAGLALLEKTRRPRYMVFLTDGLPTVGQTHTGVILQHAKGTNEGRARLFAFGVGHDVDAHFLDALADQNAGITEYVRPHEDIEAKVSAFYAKVAAPVLTDLKVKVEGAPVSEVFPREPYPDLFAGSQLVMVGTYRDPGPVTVVLNGEVAERSRTFRVRGNLTRGDQEHEFIPVVWASRKIGYLLDEVRLDGQKKELVDEIIRLSKEFGIMTEFTAFLVTEPNMAHGDAARRVADEIEVSRHERTGSWALGQSQNASRLRTAPAPQAAATSSGGYQAYGAPVPASPVGSLNQAYLDREGRVQAVQNVQNVGRRAFVQQGAVWVDQEVKANLPVVAIQNYSRAYFQLAHASADARRYLALGEEVKFVLNKQTVVIGPQGKTELTDKELRALVGGADRSAHRQNPRKALARAWGLLGGGGDGVDRASTASVSPPQPAMRRWSWAVPCAVLLWLILSAFGPRLRVLLTRLRRP